MAKVPQVQATDVDDLMMGIGQPAGEAVSTSPASSACWPGSTTFRASRSTATARRACRRSAWPSTRSRRARATASSPPASRPSAGTPPVPATPRRTRSSSRAGERTKRAPGGGRARGRHRRPARHVHRHGSDGRERRRVRGRHREEMDAFGVRSQNLAVRPRRQRLLRARDHAGDPARRHRGQQGRRPSTGHELRGGQPAEAGVPSRRHDHGRQRLPVERRRGRGDGDERHQGQASSASRRWPASSPPASPVSTPRSWASARSRRAGRRSPAPG